VGVAVAVALADAVGRGVIERGDLIVFEAIGGGLTWGAALARY
jgi:3-oxoacyl-[acyl-carrier-protein] synthase-3